MQVGKFEHILISRPDAIGDVVLTLPMAGLLKKHLPGVNVSFLGRNYTRDVVACCEHVDGFHALEDLGENIADQLKAMRVDAIIHALPNEAVVKASKQAGIPTRVGSARRWHTLTNLTHRHWFSRKKSDLHEAQLNAKLLSSFGIDEVPSLHDLASYYGFTRIPDAPQWAVDLLSVDQPNIILHPKSKGSAIDWPLDHWAQLMEQIQPDEAQLFISGTEAEGELFRDNLPFSSPAIQDISGRMSLAEFIGFISLCDGLVACSTGPLHIAAALGKRAVGLYTSQRPMHAGRWSPVGDHVVVLEAQHEDQALPFEAHEVKAALALNAKS